MQFPESDKHGDAPTVMYGVPRSGQSAMDLVGLAPFATIVVTFTSATRSSHLGQRICSTMSDHIMKFKRTGLSDDEACLLICSLGIGH